MLNFLQKSTNLEISSLRTPYREGSSYDSCLVITFKSVITFVSTGSPKVNHIL